MYPWAFRSLSLKLWAGSRKLAVPTRQVTHVPSQPPHVENERPPVHRPQMDKNSSWFPPSLSNGPRSPKAFAVRSSSFHDATQCSPYQKAATKCSWDRTQLRSASLRCNEKNTLASKFASRAFLILTRSLERWARVANHTGVQESSKKGERNARAVLAHSGGNPVTKSERSWNTVSRSGRAPRKYNARVQMRAATKIRI